MLKPRLSLAFLLIVLLGYTAAVVAEHGLSFLPAYTADLLAVNWAGQFNLDLFIAFVVLAMWMVWREKGAASGWLAAAGIFSLGMIFVLGWLIWQLSRHRSDVSLVLLGAQRPSDQPPLVAA